MSRLDGRRALRLGAASLAAFALSAAAHAGVRQQCRLECAGRVASDCVGGAKAHRQCKRLTLSECRLRARTVPPADRARAIDQFCSDDGGGTTTTITPSSTTRPPSTAAPTTTSTTLAYSFAGVWTFNGTLTRYPSYCTKPSSTVSGSIDVEHAPGSTSVIAVDHARQMSGMAASDGFDAEWDGFVNGCPATETLSVQRTGDPDELTATLFIGVNCGAGTCYGEWSGSMAR